MPFANPITYDLTGSGNRFYVVVGSNAAGEDSAAGRVAIFNFVLQPGE
jgi:hypothetical protein